MYFLRSQLPVAGKQYKSPLIIVERNHNRPPDIDCYEVFRTTN